MTDRTHRVLLPGDWDDTWHANDSIYRIREISVESLFKVMAQLPSAADWTGTALVEVAAIDPVHQVKYAVTFQRRPLTDDGRDYRWFFYTIVREEL